MKEIALKHKRPLRFVQPLPLPGTSAYRQTAGKPRMMALFEVEKPPTGHVEQNSGQTPHMPPHRYQGNLEKWKGLGLKGTAVLLQGDSRYLLKVLGQAQADANIASPPFLYTDGGGKEMPHGTRDEEQARGATRKDSYGRSPGQLGSMPSGDFAANISSPPYAGRSIPPNIASKDASSLKQNEGDGMVYGHSDGQLSALPEGSLDANISSPPFGEAETRNRTPHAGGYVGDMMSRAYTQDKQGTTEGNLATLPNEGFDAAVSSPAYGNAIDKGDGPGARHDYDTHSPEKARKVSNQASYGETEGQLAKMDAGVSSPPFERSLQSQDVEFENERQKSRGRSVYGFGHIGSLSTYGDEPGNIGNEGGNTFWEAAKTIVEQTYLALKPGAVAAWVCGNYVRDGKIVPFDEMWQQLCVSVGFEPLEVIIAWKKRPGPIQIDIHGNGHDQTRSNLSFFRLLANRNNPEAAVESETVVFVRKPI
jgi:hypothetical protein